MRAFEGEQKFTGQSFVAVAPEGMDPCDLIAWNAAMLQFVTSSQTAFRCLSLSSSQFFLSTAWIPLRDACSIAPCCPSCGADS